MVSSAAIAKRLAEAQDRVVKKALRSKQTARAFLRRAGIVDRSGKLAKPYR
jgi:hypothetical protein